jgi:hypothetical protein
MRGREREKEPQWIKYGTHSCQLRQKKEEVQQIPSEGKVKF